jgi:site-specific recombinase XerD
VKAATRTETRIEGDILAMAQSFDLHLAAANKAPRTRQTYIEAVHRLASFLAERGMPTDVANITREHVESFIADLVGRWSPATAANRFRSIQQFFKWLRDEGEITETPMVRMRPPTVPDVPVPVLRDEQLTALLKACEGSDFEDRRDAAIISLFIDAGPRVSEVAGMTTEDLFLDQKLVSVLGKGRRPRYLPVGAKTAKAIDRYLRRRPQHLDADSTALWLGTRGAMTDSGVRQMVARRARKAGIGHVWPHQLRHSFAQSWLAEGGQETDLVQVTGWKSRQMVGRYAASAAAQRAALAHRRLSPRDRL